MFTSIRIDGQNFVVMPEQGFSPEVTGSRPLTEKERKLIVAEMDSDESEGITTKELKLKVREWARLL
ncbi:MAG: hypothetical protein SGJ10_11945 [Bacteroidota bacterium]|nr:hypothetical protein [Bacteroidota bacterium]